MSSPDEERRSDRRRPGRDAHDRRRAPRSSRDRSAVATVGDRSGPPHRPCRPVSTRWSCPPQPSPSDPLRSPVRRCRRSDPQRRPGGRRPAPRPGRRDEPRRAAGVPTTGLQRGRRSCRSPPPPPAPQRSPRREATGAGTIHRGCTPTRPQPQSCWLAAHDGDDVSGAPWTSPEVVGTLRVRIQPYAVV